MLISDLIRSSVQLIRQGFLFSPTAVYLQENSGKGILSMRSKSVQGASRFFFDLRLSCDRSPSRSSRVPRTWQDVYTRTTAKHYWTTGTRTHLPRIFFEWPLSNRLGGIIRTARKFHYAKYSREGWKDAWTRFQCFEILLIIKKATREEAAQSRKRVL